MNWRSTGKLLRVALILGFIDSAVSAESTSKAMHGFGLTGTWSDDCAKDVGTIGSHRTTCSAPLIGAPTIEQISILPDGQVLKWLFDIQFAARVTVEKIKLRPVQKSIVSVVGGKATTTNLPEPLIPIEIVLIKVGNNIRVVDWKSVDGKITSVENGHKYLREPFGEGPSRAIRWRDSGQETKPSERCLN
jgi:hypothetical protein